MSYQPTGRPRGGVRPGAGRPKGARSSIYKPHAEKLLAAGGPSPRDVMLDVMRRHYRAKRYDEAARVAGLVAPYIHPRLSSSNVTIKPSLRDMLLQATDEELAEFAEEADLAADLAEVKPRGSA
jgi:hypothetical protein